MFTCLGNPPLAKGRKAFQVREPSEGAPSSIAQDLHGYAREKSIVQTSLTITKKTSTKALESKKAPKASLPWASSLVKTCLTKDSGWGNPRVM